MLVYPNKYFFRILIAKGGSVLARAVPVGTLFAIITVLIQTLASNEWVQKIIVQSYAFQQFGWLLAFALVFRTNIAWERYWNACLETAEMYSQWEDVMITVSAFFQVGTGIHDPDVEKIKYLWTARRKITHWMSMLSTSVMHNIMHSRTSVVGNLAWIHTIVPAQDVMSVVPPKSGVFTMILPLEFPQASNAKLPGYGCGEKLAEMKKINDETENAHFILDEMTPEENAQLAASTSPVDTIVCWVLATLSRVHAVAAPVPAPIYSRIYQEISNGMLGYKSAMMIADVNFPLPYAQLLQWMLVLFLISCPFAVLRSTGTENFFGPTMTFFLVTGYWAMNEMAIELENPFGEDANDVPLSDQHEDFIELLFSLYHARVPEDAVGREEDVEQASNSDLVIFRDSFFPPKPLAKLKELSPSVARAKNPIPAPARQKPKLSMSVESLASLTARLEHMTRLLESTVPVLEKLPRILELSHRS